MSGPYDENIFFLESNDEDEYLGMERNRVNVVFETGVENGGDENVPGIFEKNTNLCPIAVLNDNDEFDEYDFHLKMKLIQRDEMQTERSLSESVVLWPITYELRRFVPKGEGSLRSLSSVDRLALERTGNPSDLLSRTWKRYECWVLNEDGNFVEVNPRNGKQATPWTAGGMRRERESFGGEEIRGPRGIRFGA